MCFSPAASFVTAALTGAIGIVALTRISGPRDIPLAVMPLVFAVQQSTEGLLWLTLPSDPKGPGAVALVYSFLFFAQVFWPVYAPTAIALVEPKRARWRLMMLLVGVGAVVSALLGWGLVTKPHSALIVEGHIVYLAEVPSLGAVALAYLAATTLPLLLSSQRTLVVSGVVVLLGSVTAHFFYWEAFESVWCFFAATASATILFHFERLQQKRVSILGIWTRR